MRVLRRAVCRELDGPRVKVAFGGVWKESLSELSGGQRSLLALSLILALLLFKPAPIYILDEVRVLQSRETRSTRELIAKARAKVSKKKKKKGF